MHKHYQLQKFWREPWHVPTCGLRYHEPIIHLYDYTLKYSQYYIHHVYTWY